MNTRSLTALAMRVTGIFLFSTSLSPVLQMFSSFGMLRELSKNNDEIQRWVFIEATVPALVFLAVSIGLILFADWIARRLVPGGDTEVALAVDARTVHVLALSVLGAVLIAKGLPDVIKGIFLWFTYSENTKQAFGGKSMGYQLLRFVPAAVRVLLGLFLFLRADGLHNLWTKLRKADGVQES